MTAMVTPRPVDPLPADETADVRAEEVLDLSDRGLHGQLRVDDDFAVEWQIEHHAAAGRSAHPSAGRVLAEPSRI
jgi:hypothetical protein